MVGDIGSEILREVGAGFEYTAIDNGKETVTPRRFGMSDCLKQAWIGRVENVACEIDWIASIDRKRLRIDCIGKVRHIGPGRYPMGVPQLAHQGPQRAIALVECLEVWRCEELKMSCQNNLMIGVRP